MSPFLAARARFTGAIIAILVVAGLIYALVILAMRTREEARRQSAIGRLAQLSYGLHHYNYRNGTLPPLYLRDDAGERLHSWRTLIFPDLEYGHVFDQLDLTQAWNSLHNRNVVENARQMPWAFFTRDTNTASTGLTHITALLGPDSIWDPATGLPKGTIQQYPSAVLLISLPTSNLPVMEPRDITPEELRARVGEGQEVLYVTANRETYGIVQVENGRLLFVPRR